MKLKFYGVNELTSELHCSGMYTSRNRCLMTGVPRKLPPGQHNITDVCVFRSHRRLTGVGTEYFSSTGTPTARQSSTLNFRL